MKKIRVLEIGLLCPFVTGGVEAFIWNAYTNFDLNKYQVDFWGICPSDNVYMKYIEEHDGKLYVFNSDAYKNKIIKQLKKIKHIKNIVKNNKYDCIHIHTGDAISAFIYFCGVALYSKNIIIHSHNSVVNNIKGKKFLLHSIFKCFICGKKRILKLACSNKAGQWLFPQKCNYRVINNGIDVSKFLFDTKKRNKIRSELKIEDKFVVGHVGRFENQKNHDFLIDIFYEIYKQNKKSVLLLVGNGSLEKKIREKVHNLGLDSAVIFYGITSNVNELYQAMDCFVLPSHHEGLPIVLVETQAAALKCLCSDVITDEAKITDFLEYMSLSKDSGEWAEKILSYNNNYERKDMSDEIKAAGYDIKQTARQLEDLYYSLANK